MKTKQLIKENATMDMVEKEPFNELYPELKLYHGSHKLNTDKILKVPFKFRKRSQTTIADFHEAMNEESQEYFDLPIRNLLFCHPYEDDSFGRTYQIVPIGQCRMFFHPNINDLTVDMGYANYHVFDYDSEQFIEELVKALPSSPHMEELGKMIFDGEVIFHFDPLYLDGFVEEIVNSHDDTQQFKATIQDHSDTIHRIVEDSAYQVMLQHAGRYIDGVVEVDESNYHLIDDEEIMVYAPNGFYVVPVEE